MFRIPSFYRFEMSFEEAVDLMKSRANGDLLAGLDFMDTLWNSYCALGAEDDDAFYDRWMYEMNAYNVVIEKMRPLFA